MEVFTGTLIAVLIFGSCAAILAWCAILDKKDRIKEKLEKESERELEEKRLEENRKVELARKLEITHKLEEKKEKKKNDKLN